MARKTIAAAVVCLAVAGCASFEDELPESCIVVEESKPVPSNKVVIDTAMEVRYYRVFHCFYERMSSCEAAGFGEARCVEVKSEVVAKESDEDRGLKEFFAKCCDATWPIGSSCTYIKPLGKLRVRNTHENIVLIDELISELNARPLLEVQVRFVKVLQKTLDEIGAELFPGKGAGHRYDLSEFDAVPAAELERRLVARCDLLKNEAPRVMTLPGEEALFKSVTEYIYPTDYDVQMGSYGSCGSNGCVRVAEYGFATVEPQSFTMREVGVILDVTPTLCDDGETVDVDLDVQSVSPAEWKNYGMELHAPRGGTYALPMEQPFFPVSSSNLKLTVPLGDTVLVSSGVVHGKADESELLFLRVRNVDVHDIAAKSK